MAPDTHERGSELQRTQLRTCQSASLNSREKVLDFVQLGGVMGTGHSGGLCPRLPVQGLLQVVQIFCEGAAS